MSEVTKIYDISDIGGSLQFFEKNSEYYWGIMNYDGKNYKEIPKSLYDELKNHLIIKKLKSENVYYFLNSQLVHDIEHLEQIDDIYNGYGKLKFFKIFSKYYWGMINCDGTNYQDIHKSLYDELKNHLILEKLK